MTVPDWWTFVLLSLAAYRLWRLLAVDVILDQPRRWVVGLGYRWADGDPIPKKYREHWSLFLECPWCLGFWVALAWWGLWQIWEHGVLVVSVPLALSAVIGLVRENLDPPEE